MSARFQCADPRQHLLAGFNPFCLVLHRQQIAVGALCEEFKAFPDRVDEILVGPVIPLHRIDDIASIGKARAQFFKIIDDPPDMIRMAVGQDNRIDIFRFVASGFQITF